MTGSYTKLMEKTLQFSVSILCTTDPNYHFNNLSEVGTN